MRTAGHGPEMPEQQEVRNRRPAAKADAGTAQPKGAPARKKKMSWLSILLWAILGAFVLMICIIMGTAYGINNDARQGMGMKVIEAAREHQNQALKRLLEQGADPNYAHTAGGGRALHDAVNAGNLDGMKLLLASGADPRARNDGGVEPINVAGWCKGTVPGYGAIEVETHCVNAAVMLLDTGASANVALKDTLVTPLHQFADHESLRGVKELLRAGANPNAQMADGSTPLHILETMQDTQLKADLVIALYDAGADHTIVDQEGKAPAGRIPEIIEQYEVWQKTEASPELDVTWEAQDVS